MEIEGIDKEGINKMFDLTNLYIGKSAIDADTAYSDSALFVKRKDVDCPNLEDAEFMYSDYIIACVEQKKHFVENKDAYEKRNPDKKKWSRCPQFDYDTMRCVVMGLMLTSKYAMVQAICNDWKSDIREIYLNICESLANADDEDVSLTRKRDGDKEWSGVVKPTDSDYLSSMNALRDFDAYLTRIYGLNDQLMEEKTKDFVASKIFDIVLQMGERAVEAKVEEDNAIVTTASGKKIIIDMEEVKDNNRAEVINYMFLNKKV